MKALWGYISDKLNIPVSRLSKDNIEEELRNYGVNDALIKEFLDALNNCEFARFAPGDDDQAMDKVYSASLEVISKMENSININQEEMVMNRILFFTLSLVMAITAYGQKSCICRYIYRLVVTLHPSVHMRNSLLQDKKAM